MNTEQPHSHHQQTQGRKRTTAIPPARIAVLIQAKDNRTKTTKEQPKNHNKVLGERAAGQLKSSINLQKLPLFTLTIFFGSLRCTASARR